MATTKFRKPALRGSKRRAAQKPSVVTADFPDFAARSQGGSAPHAYMALLGLPPSESLDLWQRVASGFSYKTFEHFQRNIGLPVKEVVGLLQIPQTTLVRRRKSGQLGPLESDRLVRFGRLLGMAVELFEGDAEAARKWLMSPQRALGGVAPLQMARTEVGAREVEQLIGRLEHGVFS